MEFTRATKQSSLLRLAVIGPSGSGKTYTALKIATGLGGPVALIDTERGSASKYADEFNFDVLELASFSPQRYCEAIEAAGKEGYHVLIVDSLSHAWTGKEGALELVDKAAKRSQSGNSYFAWREVTPLHNKLVDTMLQADCHLIATLRAKTEYVIQEVNGKQVPKKIGMAPIQRDGLEYEFDVVADMDLENNFIVSKTRCRRLTGAVIPKPGAEVVEILRNWLEGGGSPPAQVHKSPMPPAPPPENGLDAAKARFLETAETLIEPEVLHNARKLAAFLGEFDPGLNKPIDRYNQSDWQSATEALVFLEPI